jgi:hypothetical protein
MCRLPQLWVFVNNPRKCVVVAFRGTEQVKWKDFLTDMRVNPTTFNTERVQGSRVPQLEAIGVVSAVCRVSEHEYSCLRCLAAT